MNFAKEELKEILLIFIQRNLILKPYIYFEDFVSHKQIKYLIFLVNKYIYLYLHLYIINSPLVNYFKIMKSNFTLNDPFYVYQCI